MARVAAHANELALGARSLQISSIEAALLQLAAIANTVDNVGMNLRIDLFSQPMEVNMEIVNEALTLLKRQAQLEHAIKQPGGIRIADEQELHV